MWVQCTSHSHTEFSVGTSGMSRRTWNRKLCPPARNMQVTALLPPVSLFGTQLDSVHSNYRIMAASYHHPNTLARVLWTSLGRAGRHTGEARFRRTAVQTLGVQHNPSLQPCVVGIIIIKFSGSSVAAAATVSTPAPAFSQVSNTAHLQGSGSESSHQETPTLAGLVAGDHFGLHYNL